MSFFEKEHDGEKISPKTVLNAQPNNGKLQSRFSTYVKNGEECQFTTEQKKIFADLFTLKNGKSKSNMALLAIFFLFLFSLDLFFNRNKTAILISVLFIAIIIVLYLAWKKRENALSEAVENGHYKMYMHVVDEKKWSVSFSAEEGRFYEFYIHAGDVYFRIDSDFYCKAAIGESVYAAVISTNSGEYLHLFTSSDFI